MTTTGREQTQQHILVSLSSCVHCKLNASSLNDLVYYCPSRVLKVAVWLMG